MIADFLAAAQVGYFHGFIDGVDWVFIDHPCFHGREHDIYGGSRQDIQFRCALLCKAAIEAPWHVPCGGSVYGDDNLVYLANDWHTGLLPVYLQVRLFAASLQTESSVGLGHSMRLIRKSSDPHIGIFGLSAH